jgi:hypothetical protein
MRKLVALALFLLSPVFVRAEDFRHEVSLRSQEGVDIAVRYDVGPEESGLPGRLIRNVYASAFVVAVAGPALRADQAVSVVVVNRHRALGQTSASTTAIEKSYSLELQYDSRTGGYRGAWGPDVRVWRDDAWAPVEDANAPRLLLGQDSTCFSVWGGIDLAVVVDGQWLRDPVTGQSNFRVR